MKYGFFGFGAGLITAMSGVSIIEKPVVAIATIAALVILHRVTS